MPIANAKSPIVMNLVGKQVFGGAYFGLLSNVHASRFLGAGKGAYSGWGLGQFRGTATDVCMRSYTSYIHISALYIRCESPIARGETGKPRRQLGENRSDTRHSVIVLSIKQISGSAGLILSLCI